MGEPYLSVSHLRKPTRICWPKDAPDDKISLTRSLPAVAHRASRNGSCSTRAQKHRHLPQSQLRSPPSPRGMRQYPKRLDSVPNFSFAYRTFASHAQYIRSHLQYAKVLDSFAQCLPAERHMYPMSFWPVRRVVPTFYGIITLQAVIL